MNRFGLKWFLFLVYLTPGWPCCLAQSRVFDATDLRGPTDLAEGWLVYAGDDPAFARPDFDDSSWTPFNTTADSLHKLFPGYRPEVVWYRLHVKVAPTHGGMALLETGISRAFEVYSNGAKLIQAGRIQPYSAYDTRARLLAPIPESQVATGSIVVALRVHIDPREWSFLRPGYSSANLTLGMESALREHVWFSIITGHALDWLDDLLNICLLLGGVLLYSTQRNRPEYLWLSLWTLAWLSTAPLDLYSRFRTFPLIWHALDASILCFLGLYSVTRMYCAFVDHQVGWGLRLYVVVAAICAYLANIAFLFGLNLGVQLLATLPLVFLFSVVIPFIVVRGMRRGRSAERLLLLPVLLIGVYFVITDSAELVMQIPAVRDRVLRFIPLAFGSHVGPFYLGYNSLSDLLAKLSLALIILIRSNHMSRQQSLLEAEIANAREVQQVILPEAIETVQGFQVESVYVPSRQVGGDFFQILPLGDGGLLVVIGDVAGKGLPAAMLVSVLVGAVRSIVKYDQSPAALLAELNGQIIGRTKGGFATALAALITADGSVRIANAGHLSPYLNGRELELAPALPLGIVTGVRYDEKEFRIDPLDRLTFYSDGVIEARNKNHELFGFDRGRDISTQPAAAIADAAKAFGQEDDITVVSIQRVPVTDSRPVEILTAIREPAGM